MTAQFFRGICMAITNPINFYEIDIDYVRMLNSIDSEVYYVNTPEYRNKPYVGIIQEIGNVNYFIPLTSRKSGFEKLKNTGPDYALIFEYVYRQELTLTDVYCLHSENPSDPSGQRDIVKKILSMLNYRKAIPVPSGCFHPINIRAHLNRDLLSKEYNFLGYPAFLWEKLKGDGILSFFAHSQNCGKTNC